MDSLTPQEIALIREVPHFRSSGEGSLDIGLIYQHYASAFVSLLDTFRVNPKPRVFADIGTGYGWLAIALAREFKTQIIAVECDPARLRAARSIAAILGVEQAIDWRLGCLPQLPLADEEADVTFCIEVIEHVSNRPEVVHDLGRITRDMLVITTPNRNFPVIQHDTRLPFCHRLSFPMRNRYATLFGRLHLQENSTFWSSSMISTALPAFDRVSRFLQFPSYRHFHASEEELYKVTGIAAPVRRVLRKHLFGVTALLGKNSIYLLPNLASTFRRIKSL